MMTGCVSLHLPGMAWVYLTKSQGSLIYFIWELAVHSIFLNKTFKNNPSFLCVRVYLFIA